MDWRRWASIARLTIRKMSCLNGSRKLLTQKIIACSFYSLRIHRIERIILFDRADNLINLRNL